MSRSPFPFPFPPSAIPFPLGGNLPFLAADDEKGDSYAFFETIILEAERFLRGLVGGDEEQLKQNILYYYRLVAAKLPPSPLIKQIESWLNQLEPAAIKSSANEAIGLLFKLKKPEFREAALGLLQNVSPPTLLFILFAFTQNGNPHETIYYFSLIPHDLMGSVILSVFRNRKDRAILKGLLSLITPTSLSGITALNMLTTAESTAENPIAKKALQAVICTSRLLSLARQKLIQASKHTPLALPAYPQNAGIIAKSLGTIYFLMLTPIITSGRLAIWDSIPAATGLLPFPYWLNVIVRNGLNISAVHQVAKLTQELMGFSQQTLDETFGNNSEQRIINGWRIYQRVADQVSRLTMDPFEVAYYTTMLIATLQFGDRLFNLNPDALLSLSAKSILYLAQALIYLAPLKPIVNQILPSRVSQLARQVSDAVVPHITQSLTHVAERFSQSPLVFGSENPSEDFSTRFEKAKNFVLLNGAVNYVLPYSAEWLTYTLFGMISLYSPAADNPAAYQAFSFAVDQQLGNTVRAASQFIATAAIYKACEHITPKIPIITKQVKNAADYAREKYLQACARWNPDNYIDLARYYREQKRYDEAFAAYETYTQIITPTRKQLKTLKKTLRRHHSPSKTKNLPSWLHRAMEAHSYFLAREVNETVKKLGPTENQGKKVQKGLEEVLSGDVVLRNQWDVAEHYLKMGLKKQAIALYKSLLSENEKIKKPEYDLLSHIRELKDRKITTIDQLIARYAEIEHLRLILPRVVEAYLVAQGNILIIHRILELIDSPQELAWLHKMMNPKSSLNPYHQVEFYRTQGLVPKTACDVGYEEYLKQRASENPENNLQLACYYEETMQYNKAINAYQRVAPKFQANMYKCRMLQVLQSLPATPEIDALRKQVLNGEISVTSKLALAEQYRKWKLYSLAADIYREIIADQPNEDPVEDLIDELEKPELQDRIAARKTILSCRLALKIIGAPNYDRDAPLATKERHEKILNEMFQDKHLIKKVILAIYYKRVFLYYEASQLYASVSKPPDAEISKIDPKEFSNVAHQENIQANIEAIHARGITTIDQLLENYRHLPYNGSTPTIPQFSKKINAYIVAQVNYAICALSDVITNRFSTCKTPQDYQALIPLLDNIKPTLDKLITHPSRCTDANFYRLAEWDAIYAAILILSHSNPKQGKEKITYLITVDDYYPTRNHKEGSIESVLLPTLTKVISVLEKRTNSEALTSQCRQLAEQAKQQLTTIKKQKEDEQIEAICKHTAASGELLEAFMQQRKLTDYEVVKEQGKQAKDQGKHALAHVLYLVSVQLMKKQYPNIESEIAIYPIYLRTLYQCANTLISYADSLSDSSLKLRLYKQAQFYFEEIAKKESAPYKVAHNVYFPMISLAKQIPNVGSVINEHADLRQFFFSMLNQFAQILETRRDSLPTTMTHLYDMVSRRPSVMCSDTSRKPLSTQIGEILNILAGKISTLSSNASVEQPDSDSLASLCQPVL